MFGIPTPDNHHDGASCGNCNSKDTTAYYPMCCIEHFDEDVEEIMREQIKRLGW